ncbi:phosphoesterase [Pilimelia anulata]|uniref:Phosphoesterase n=1 Tax=Pilimelia anulata TaxID=53371 RepID=A0A8J3BBL7_9ACTN|nr:2'-5' RNA ligase family protein [Pilimelia anulata]GGJ92665.1 phosphoesterase [Pilimelia anulata]
MAVLVGVVVNVPPPRGDILHEHRVRAGDPLAGEVPPHLTLLPPARLPGERLPGLEEHLGAVAARTAPYELRLRGTGSFRPVSDVVFVRVVGGFAESVALAAELAAFAGLAPESGYPFHPHVTVAHNVPGDVLDGVEAALADFTAEFSVTGFRLYLGDGGGRWRPRRAFGLAG